MTAPARLWIPCLVLLLFTLGACATPAPAEKSIAVEEARREVTFQLGQRSLDSDWSPNEDQFLVGVDFAWQPPGAWVELDAGLHFSWDDSELVIGPETFDADARLYEFFVGIKKSFPIEALRLRPYIGGGASLLYADFEGAAGGAFIEDEEVTLGGYAKGGMLIQITQETFVGIEVRGMAASDVTISGEDVAVDSLQVAFVFSAIY